MSGELQNIPGYWTALTHSFSCLLYMSMLPKRLRGWKFWAAALALFLPMIPYMDRVAALSGFPFNVGMSVFAIWTAVPFLLLCREDGYRGVYYCARAFILGGFAISLAWQLYMFYARRVIFLERLWVQAVLILVIEGAVFLLMYALERIHLKESAEMPVTRAACVSTVAIALVIYILSSLSYAAVESPFTTQRPAEAFNIRTIVYLGGVAILYAHHLQLCDAYALQEVTALQNVVNMQYANYQLSRESMEMVNRKYHDLKHQIAVLRSEIDSKDKTAVLDQLEREIRAFDIQCHTGNRVMDAILTRKSAYCQDHGIQFTCVADGHALDFMGVVELSTLLGNALDNAIEGVSKVAEPEQRVIHLSVSQQRGFLRMSLENRCLEDVATGKELPQTTKADRSQHGYGLKSIRSTVEQYGGSLTLKAENGWFTLGVLIPMEQAKD